VNENFGVYASETDATIIRNVAKPYRKYVEVNRKRLTTFGFGGGIVVGRRKG
jgi:hypothetical protein